ncbi:MAG: hypothetical protein V5B30_20765 [Candidatus Accumulibacter delftensis]|jgi:hypothetical protein
MLFFIDQQHLAGDFMGNLPDGRRRYQFLFLQGHGDACGVGLDVQR